MQQINRYFNIQMRLQEIKRIKKQHIGLHEITNKRDYKKKKLGNKISRFTLNNQSARSKILRLYERRSSENLQN